LVVRWKAEFFISGPRVLIRQLTKKKRELPEIEPRTSWCTIYKSNKNKAEGGLVFKVIFSGKNSVSTGVGLVNNLY